MPVLDIVEMGILRDIDIDENLVTVRITPTYSGCPAMTAIEMEIINTLKSYGFTGIRVIKDYSQAWTTDWMTREARNKLQNYGIAPPEPGAGKDLRERKIPCPYCGSTNTEMQAAFGATACKALYYCHHCDQPFEHFKCH